MSLLSHPSAASLSIEALLALKFTFQEKYMTSYYFPYYYELLYHFFLLMALVFLEVESTMWYQNVHFILYLPANLGDIKSMIHLERRPLKENELWLMVWNISLTSMTACFIISQWEGFLFLYAAVHFWYNYCQFWYRDTLF